MSYGRAAAIAGCYVVALLSKEQGMLLPLLLVLLGWVVYRGMPATAGPVSPGERRALGVLAMVVCWSLAGYIVLRETWIRFWWDRTLLDWTVNPLLRSHGADRWLVPVALLGRYTALLVAPRTLALDYGGHVIPPAIRWGEPYFWLGAIAFLLWIVLLVAALRRRAWPTAFCLLAMGITYGMVA